MGGWLFGVYDGMRYEITMALLVMPMIVTLEQLNNRTSEYSFRHVVISHMVSEQHLLACILSGRRIIPTIWVVLTAFLNPLRFRFLYHHLVFCFV